MLVRNENGAVLRREGPAKVLGLFQSYISQIFDNTLK